MEFNGILNWLITMVSVLKFAMGQSVGPPRRCWTSGASSPWKRRPLVLSDTTCEKRTS
jgi:hypothetical protein